MRQPTTKLSRDSKVKHFQIISSVLVAGALVLPACGESSEDSDSTTTITTSSSTGEESATDTDTDTATATATATATDTEPTTDTDPTDTTTDDATSSFVNSDAAGPSCGEECDIWNPADCPEGEKCTSVGCEVGATGWDSNVCREIQGSATTGDECMYVDGSGLSGNDTCETGNMCWDADPDTGIGNCIAFCTGSADAGVCNAGTSCVVANDGVLPICLPGCDPLVQDCDGDDLCIPDFSMSGYVCVLDASGGMAPYGTPCDCANCCNAGLTCEDAEQVPEAECEGASGCCTPLCSISSGDPCPGQGQTCEPYFEPQPPGFEDVGSCLVVL